MPTPAPGRQLRTRRGMPRSVWRRWSGARTRRLAQQWRLGTRLFRRPRTRRARRGAWRRSASQRPRRRRARPARRSRRSRANVTRSRRGWSRSSKSCSTRRDRRLSRSRPAHALSPFPAPLPLAHTRALAVILAVTNALSLALGAGREVGAALGIGVGARGDRRQAPSAARRVRERLPTREEREFAA